MKYTQQHRRVTSKIKRQMMRSFWEEITKAFPEADSSQVKHFVGRGSLEESVESWYEATTSTDPSQCASVLEKVVEDTSANHPQDLEWTSPNGIGEGTVELYLHKSQLKGTGVSLNELYRCLSSFMPEVNRELERVVHWDIEGEIDVDGLDDGYFEFTKFQVALFKRANQGLRITFLYAGYDHY